MIAYTGRLRLKGGYLQLYEGVGISLVEVYSYFEKGCRKNVHATIPKGSMGYDQYTVSDDVEPTFVAFL